MASGGDPIGTIFVELDLDASRYLKGQRQLLKDATSTALNVEQNFKNLGIKSQATFELMAKKAINSNEMIKNSARATANDRLRAEKALTAQLKSLHEQQYGVQQSFIRKAADGFGLIASSSLGAAGIATAAFAGVGMGMKAAFSKGFEAVENFKKDVASLAALVVTFTERSKGETVADQWELALGYSTKMIPVLENIAAKTLLSGTETTALANAFARSGVFLDANNSKQIESFQRISNALPLMTRGQEIMRQINTEIRSLLTGVNEQNAMLLMTLKAIDPEIEGHLKIWREQGTVLENVGNLLVGFGPASKLLEVTWESVKSTIDTTVTQTLRGGMFGAFEEILGIVLSLDDAMQKHKATIQGGIAVAWSMVSNTINYMGCT
jgi:hypothetical protein